MDDNTNQAQPQNTQGINSPQNLQGSFTPAQNVPVQNVQSPFPQQENQQPAASAPSQPVFPTQPTISVQPQPSEPTQESPRFTLDDLYGPSAPADHAGIQQAPPETAGETVPTETVSTAQTFPPSMQQSGQQEMQSLSGAASQSPVEPIFPTIAQQPMQQEEHTEESLGYPAQQSVQSPFNSQSQQSSVDSDSESSQSNDSSKGGKRIHLPFLLRFMIGGIIVLIVVLCIWGIGSLIFSQKSSDNGKVTLTYWGLWEDPNVMQTVLAGFEKQHPNITVNYTREDPKDYVKRFLQRTNDGNGPDLLRIHNTWVYPLQNSLLPLPSNVITNTDIQNNYPPTVSKDLVVNGALYGLPLQMDTLALYVNSDMFTHAGAKVPTTWNDFITVAKALTVKDPNGHIQTSGAAIGAYDNIAHAPDIMSMLFLQNGANLQKLENSENANDALSFYTSFTSSTGNVWDTTLDNSLSAFTAGKVAMYFGYSYDIFAIKAVNPALHFALYPVPHLPGRTISIASYWAEAVSSKSKHQKEALELLHYLAQKDTQTQLYTEETKARGFGELYARKDLAQTLTNNSIIAPFVKQFDTAESSFFSSDTDYDEYNGSLNQYLGNTINSILKGTSPDTAAATLGQGVGQVLSQFGQKTP